MYDWNKIYEQGRDFTPLDTKRIQKIAKFAESIPKKTFLDIGCGTGKAVRDMYHLGFIAHGVDTSRAAIDIARQSSVYAGRFINFYIGDILSAPEKMYNLILCKHAVAFVEDRVKFYEQIKAKMQTGSKFVIITPQIDTLPEIKKNIAIEDKLLSKELDDFFEVVEKEKSGSDWLYTCSIS